MKHLTLFWLLMLSSACSCQVSPEPANSSEEFLVRYDDRDRDANQCRAFCEANRMKVVIWTGRSTKTEFCGCAPEDAPCH